MVKCPNCGSKSGDKFAPRYVGVGGSSKTPGDLYECQQCHTLINVSSKGGVSSIW